MNLALGTRIHSFIHPSFLSHTHLLYQLYSILPAITNSWPLTSAQCSLIPYHSHLLHLSLLLHYLWQWWWRTEKRGVLQPVGFQRVGHNWVTKQQPLPLNYPSFLFGVTPCNFLFQHIRPPSLWSYNGYHCPLSLQCDYLLELCPDAFSPVSSSFLHGTQWWTQHS